MHATKQHSPWYTTVVAGMASYLDAAGIVSTGTALVLYQHALGLTPGIIGKLSSLLTIGIAIGAIVGGRLGDRYGRRKVFTVTMILYTLAGVALVFAGSAGLLYVAIPALGFAVGADLPVSLSMIAEEAPEEHRGKMISFTHILWMVGVLVTMGIAAIVGDMGRTGGQILYGHLVVVAVVVLVLRSTLPESREWAAAHSSEAAVADQPGLKDLVKGPYLMPLLGTGLFYAAVNVAANTNGQFSTYIWVNVAHSTVRMVSIVGIIATLIAVASLTFLMKIVDTPNRMKVFTACAFGCVIAWLLPIIFGFSPVTLTALAINYSISGAVCGEPMWKVWSQELFPTTLRSTAQGTTTAFTRVVAALVALWTPSVLSAGPKVLYGFVVALLVIGALIGIFWLARTPTAKQREASTDATE